MLDVVEHSRSFYSFEHFVHMSQIFILHSMHPMHLHMDMTIYLIITFNLFLFIKNWKKTSIRSKIENNLAQDC